MVCRLTTTAVAYTLYLCVWVDVFFAFLFKNKIFAYANATRKKNHWFFLCIQMSICQALMSLHTYIVHFIYVQELTTNNSISIRSTWKIRFFFRFSILHIIFRINFKAQNSIKNLLSDFIKWYDGSCLKLYTIFFFMKRIPFIQQFIMYFCYTHIPYIRLE